MSTRFCLVWWAAMLAMSARGAPPAPETLLERAYQLEQAATEPQRGAVVEAYQRAAEEGDAWAHLRLGYLFETGRGVTHDYAQARHHYQAAAAAGLAEARVRLALFHLEGWGGPVDRGAFVDELQQAAEANNVSAQRMLSSVYLIGLHVPPDRAQAVRWLERAAAGEDAATQYELGVVLEGPRKAMKHANVELARTWYQLSAEQDHATAMRAMARTLLHGDRAHRDWQLGRRWLELATESGDEHAPYTLALVEMLYPQLPLRDSERARRWLRLASERGNSRATEILELEAAGRSLVEAMQYVLRTPFEERYIEQQTRSAEKQDLTDRRYPRVVRVVRPVYPRALQLADEEGKVEVAFIVGVDGRVREAQVDSASHPVMGERAVQAVKQWRFQPGYVNGAPVMVRMQVPIYFRIEEEVAQGADGLLSGARQKAEELGEPAQTDVQRVRMGKPAEAKSALPAPPAAGRAMILLVLGDQGQVVRSHVLHADPIDFGAAAHALARQRTYEVQRDGAGEVLNVLLPIVSRPSSSGAPRK